MIIYVNGPDLIDKHRQDLNKVTELTFNFASLALKNTDHEKLLLTWITECEQITSLKLQQCQLDKLPKQVTKCPIKKLELTNCRISDFNQIFRNIPHLESLTVNNGYVNFLPEISNASKLKELLLNCEEITTLKGISSCKALEHLNLQKANLEIIPEEVSELKNLKRIHLNNLHQLKKLPSLKNCHELESLYISSLNSVSEFNINFNALQSLTALHLGYIGNINQSINFPESISNCTNLKHLTLTSCNFQELPKSLSGLKNLTNLTLSHLKINHLPDIFGDMSQLTNVTMYQWDNIKTIPPSFGNLTQLTELKINYLRNLEKLDFDFSKLQSLTKLDIIGLEKLDSIPTSLGQCYMLQSLSLNYLPCLKELPDDIFAKTNLFSIRLLKLPITSIPDSIFNNKNLVEFSLNETPKLEYFPKGIGKLEQLVNLSIGMTNPEKFNTAGFNTRQDEYFKTDGESRAHLFDWIFFKEKSIPTSVERGSIVLKTMSLGGTKRIDDVLLENIPFLNPDGKPIDSTAIANGGKVFISGRLTGRKEEAINKLEGLGLKVVSKLSDDVAFVLLGKKPKYVEGLFNGKRIYFTSKEMEDLKKEINPGMLQSKDTPPHFVENLNELLLSTDNDNVQVALGLVENHGLPSELEEVFLAISHTLPKGKLKNAVKRFLRGKVSPKKEKILETKTYPFAPHKVKEFLTPEEATRYYYTEFKRTGMVRPEFFQFNDGDHPYRKEYFEKIVPTMTNNPKRLNLNAAFTVEEYNEIFNLPKLKGQLKELIIFYPKCGGRIASLIEHKASLTKLQLGLHLVEKDFPTSIYELENLTGLRIGMHHLPTLPPGIGKLTKLKKLVIINPYGKNLNLPDDLVELKKLTSFYLQTSVNIDKFKGMLPAQSSNVKI